MNGNLYQLGLIIKETEDKFVMTMLVLGIRKYIPLSFCISLSLRLHEIQKLHGIYFRIPKTNIVITNLSSVSYICAITSQYQCHNITCCKSPSAQSTFHSILRPQTSQIRSSSSGSSAFKITSKQSCCFVIGFSDVCGLSVFHNYPECLCLTAQKNVSSCC